MAVLGNYIFVGAAREDEDDNESNTLSASGSVYVFERDAMGTWSQVQKIVASDREAGDTFGASLNANGNYLVIGAPLEDNGDNSNNGAAYIFENIAGTFHEIQKITASNRGVNDRFGNAVDIDGDIAIIGAYNKDINGESFCWSCLYF